jgi:kynurenine formamidase
MMVDAATSPDANVEYTAWIEELGRTHRRDGDKLGTARLIDDAARQRAAGAIKTGKCVALNRPLALGQVDDSGAETDGTGIRVEVHHTNMSGFGDQAAVDIAAGDRTQIEAHGTNYTHMDALNHMGRRGKWYGGFDAHDPQGPSIADLASHLLFTRAVVADIPSVRGTDWVDAAQPVTAADIDQAMDRAGVQFLPGDALLLYMGRDRFEEAGNHYDLQSLISPTPLPGAGMGVARWIAAHGVSLLAWDFLDAFPRTDTEPSHQVHSLLWAIGLVLLDNCHLGDAAAAARRHGTHTGALVVATPPIPRVTGALVQPMFIQ